MSYLVLARKHRPQTFNEVVRQDHVTRTLANAISSDRVAHAILFAGPRGTGKTTVARILAKAMNCGEKPTPAPCNNCRSCREITSGSSTDVFEIDGASNNSVDQIRELRENVKYMPSNSLFKIYIIDEVHMLSIAAFNALLKTLEEPPSHVMFIFATTEPHKIPVTILSRCQRHDFRRIDVESISKHMEMLCVKEGVDIARESLSMIAREAGGSLRDALSLLDQVISCADEKIEYEYILDILGVIDRKMLFDISGAIFQGGINEVLDTLDKIYDSGHDMKKLHSDLIEHFRNLLVVKIGKKIGKLVDLPAHEIDLMLDQVKDTSSAFLNQIFELLFKEEATVRYSAQPKLALEMIFIRIFQIKPALPIDVLIEKIDNLRKNIVEMHGNSVIKSQNGLNDRGTETSISNSGRIQDKASKPIDLNENHNETWGRIFEIISEKYPSLAANLTRCTLKKIAGDSLEIEANGNDFNVSMIRRSKNIAIIKKVCSDIFGKKMDIIITPKAAENHDGQRNKKQGNHLKKEALGHPRIADAIEIFNGKVIDVKLL